ncbi:uncharacterized protein BT62DRAFT_1001299 [Guyanagaster necrorhizus]|uniref:Uncharacterized protein n=1 Tax=Guyanagaster necrorhizus TaxID=856835 RepID=A0A9P7W0R3_9AGAR|nr:uncharacterized protein BT62DRAFT_1001299 [Guyanagaster necrorhizus MCA 3950]KAG7450482.1 hypothetical protein BT62DRAFT_1001299 [Guyanagaster necrorhizus MCA 3950]
MTSAWHGRLTNAHDASCPCDSAETLLWNRNWFSNAIGVPHLVVEACMIMGQKELAEDVANYCMFMSGRSYEVFDLPVKFMIGSNILDVSKIGIDAGLLSSSETLVADAYSKIHQEIIIKNVANIDEIRSDGSFGLKVGNLTHANAGNLKGNRMIYINDYMPFGFHLSNGALYTYLKGNDYKDIAAAWDWNLIPGIAVDYNAMALNCSHNQFPSTTNAPVYSVIDQKHNSLRHSNVGYILDRKSSISYSVKEKSGNWSSTQLPTDVTLFSARLHHNVLNASLSYTAFPGTDLDTFRSKSRQFSLQSTQNDAQVSAIYDHAHETVFVVFWNDAGGSTNLNITHFKHPDADNLVITVNGNVAFIYDQRTNNMSLRSLVDA